MRRRSAFGPVSIASSLKGCRETAWRRTAAHACFASGPGTSPSRSWARRSLPEEAAARAKLEDPRMAEPARPPASLDSSSGRRPQDTLAPTSLFRAELLEVEESHGHAKTAAKIKIPRLRRPTPGQTSPVPRMEPRGRTGIHFQSHLTHEIRLDLPWAWLETEKPMQIAVAHRVARHRLHRSAPKQGRPHPSLLLGLGKAEPGAGSPQPPERCLYCLRNIVQ